MKTLISTCLQASCFATSSSICLSAPLSRPFFLPSPKRKPYLLLKDNAVPLTLHPSVCRLLPKSRGQSHLYSPWQSIFQYYPTAFSHPASGHQDAQFADRDTDSEKLHLPILAPEQAWFKSLLCCLLAV